MVVDLPITVIISAASLLAGVGGSLAVTRDRTNLGTAEIKELRNTLHEMGLVMAGLVERVSFLHDMVKSGNHKKTPPRAKPKSTRKAGKRK